MESTKARPIVSSPTKCGGKPRLEGTRIRVWDIYVLHELEGKTADEVADAFPELSLADIDAALSYYFEHKAEIDEQMRDADDRVRRTLESSGPGPLARRLARK